MYEICYPYIYVAQFAQFTDQKKKAFPKTVKG